MKKDISKSTYPDLVNRIADILVAARTKVVREINRAQVIAYWEIGREIVEFEQKGKKRGEYGKQLIERLSEDMTQKFGRGFSSTNLKMTRLFYQAFPIRQTLSDESAKGQKFPKSTGDAQILSAKFEPMLSWSHYCELLKVEKSLSCSFS